MQNLLASEQDRGAFFPTPSDHVDAAVLAADTATRMAVPTGAAYVMFSATGGFYAKWGDSSVTAAAPDDDVTDGSGSELNPAGRRIPEGATHVSLIASADAVVTLSWYGT
jgi:hypothetical protein